MRSELDLSKTAACRGETEPILRDLTGARVRNRVLIDFDQITRNRQLIEV